MSQLNADSTWRLDPSSRTRPAVSSGGLPHIYSYYRAVLGASLLVVFLNDGGRRLLGALDADLFLQVITAYIGVNILAVTAGFLAPNSFLDRRSIHFSIAVADILALTVLTYASGGIGSGLGAMILLTVAAGTILTTGPANLVLPAVATIGVLYVESLLYFSATGRAAGFFQAGMLGVLYFGATIFVRSLSDRLRATEAESLRRAQEIAQLERLSETIIQRMRTGILVANAQGRVRLCNRAAQSLLGLQVNPVGDALPGAILARFRDWQSQKRQDTNPLQLAAASPELRVSFSALGDQHDTDTIVFLEDHGELSQQAQQLKLAALGRLSASISHEIRNPLGAVSHAAQLLNESNAISAGDRRLAQIIEHHTRRMNEIIRNVLELSRGRVPEPAKITLEDWLLAFVSEYRESHGQPVEITVDVSPPGIVVNFDPSQLRQVLTNLTDNALRYSARHSGHPVALVGAGVDSLSERPYLAVSDHGPGVAADRIPNLFEPFYTTEAQGTGLGLYISRELCAANQARLSYSPAAGGGACFRITFPHPDRTA